MSAQDQKTGYLNSKPARAVIIGLRSMLGHSTEQSMSPYNDVVKLAPKQANLTMTLP